MYVLFVLFTTAVICLQQGMVIVRMKFLPTETVVEIRKVSKKKKKNQYISAIITVKQINADPMTYMRICVHNGATSSMFIAM